MKVSLGTIEVDDDVRKAVRKAQGRRGGHATRNEMKEFLQGVIDNALADPDRAVSNANSAPADPEGESEPDEIAMTGSAAQPGLPEPTAAGDSTPYSGDNV